jgi:hypothetical protein
MLLTAVMYWSKLELIRELKIQKRRIYGRTCHAVCGLSFLHKEVLELMVTA